MPMTENELRSLLRDRAAAAPVEPDRVTAVRARAAARRRRELAIAAGALAVVVAAGAVWALPRPGAAPAPPASPSPTGSADPGGTIVTTGDVAGLTATVSGPGAVAGTAPFALELILTNPGPEPWSGSVGAGAVVEASVPGLYEGGIINPTAEVDPEDYSGFGATLPDRQLQGVIVSDGVTLAPGETRRWTFDVQRDPAYPVEGAILGWAPFANSDASESELTTPTAGLTAVTFTPAASSRGETRPWTLDLAYTAVVGSDRRAEWTEIAGLGDQGTSVTSTQEGAVRSSTVMRALDAVGAATASGFGASLPDRPATLDPGRYVAYSGTRLVPVDFEGTCGPSGEPISGQWVAYDKRTVGLLDCAVRPPAGSLGALATDYCPRD
jgi:hypothetical protein